MTVCDICSSNVSVKEYRVVIENVGSVLRGELCIDCSRELNNCIEGRLVSMREGKRGIPASKKEGK